MTRKAPKDIAASVRERLLFRSRQTGEDFLFLLQRYACERFLYRLGNSTFRDRFVLKGAMLFALWGGSTYRPTRDIDLMGYGSSDARDVVLALRNVCDLDVADDGLVFDSKTMDAAPIRELAEYAGLRVKFVAMLGSARILMQIDVGFGDAIEPPPAEIDYPTLLDAPAPRILAYQRESVIAEKLHAIVLLGERNSRNKDFYDLHALAQHFHFDGESLTRAVAATFERRRTLIEAQIPSALSSLFFLRSPAGSSGVPF